MSVEATSDAVVRAAFGGWVNVDPVDAQRRRAEEAFSDRVLGTLDPDHPQRRGHAEHLGQAREIQIGCQRRISRELELYGRIIAYRVQYALEASFTRVTRWGLGAAPPPPSNFLLAAMRDECAASQPKEDDLGGCALQAPATRATA